MVSIIIITPEYYMDIGERFSHTLDADIVIQYWTTIGGIDVPYTELWAYDLY